jgi:AraC family transcriptional regulator of adaptative response/methylated-DNA-[protein]-cysteine methyltransferase
MTVLHTQSAWQQIQAHDPSGDGQFVYAVRTTGIYCRPSCPSRRPARKNVVFYPTVSEARAAGYRACKRCRPDSLHPQASMVAETCRYLDQPREKAPTLPELGQAMGMSPYSLQRLFRQVLGITPRQYIATRQTKRLQRELATSASVTSAMYEAGYGSPSRIYEKAGERLGMTPNLYRRQGAGQQIRYTTASTRLGTILVAATDRGICAVAFADHEKQLIADLQRDFRQADLQRDDQALATRLSAVLAQLEEHPIGATLPLDIRATAFQRRVWEALQQIPRGETRSYGEIALALGQPTAMRAVARACSQNPVALIIPCHRVVGKNGRLTGYRCGLARKQNLLTLEHNSSFLGQSKK